MKSLIIALVLLLGVSVGAEEDNTLSPQEAKDGWKLLFDGKTMKGWNAWKTKKPLTEGGWVVKDGALSRVAKGAGDAYTAEAYENYELKIDWKTTGNSGIFIRVDSSLTGPIFRVAPEMQVERLIGKGPKSLASLYDLYEVEGEKVFHPREWNSVRIRIVDGEATHWFNDKKIYSYKIGSDDWKKRIAGSKWSKAKGYGETAKGHIGLQDHNADVSYKNIKIKILD